MLFKLHHLEGIRNGSITVAFRKWKKASVKKGTLLKTRIGQVEILDISKISISSLTKVQASKAGYDDPDVLRRELNRITDGDLYRIKVRYHSPDPRIKLRNKASMSGSEAEAIRDKLARYDKYSKHGPWTRRSMKAIQKNPEVRAQDLADELGYEKKWFKTNIRKLKNLGLTISHGVGYSLSPRGKKILDSM